MQAKGIAPDRSILRRTLRTTGAACTRRITIGGVALFGAGEDPEWNHRSEWGHGCPSFGGGHREPSLQTESAASERGGMPSSAAAASTPVVATGDTMDLPGVTADFVGLESSSMKTSRQYFHVRSLARSNCGEHLPQGRCHESERQVCRLSSRQRSSQYLEIHTRARGRSTPTNERRMRRGGFCWVGAAHAPVLSVAALAEGGYGVMLDQPNYLSYHNKNVSDLFPVQSPCRGPEVANSRPSSAMTSSDVRWARASATAGQRIRMSSSRSTTPSDECALPTTRWTGPRMGATSWQIYPR